MPQIPIVDKLTLVRVMAWFMQQFVCHFVFLETPQTPRRYGMSVECIDINLMSPVTSGLGFNEQRGQRILMVMRSMANCSPLKRF